MVWMETFCFYCSVRLGAILSICITLLEILGPLVALLVSGTRNLQYLIEIVREDEDFKDRPGLSTVLKMAIERPSDTATVLASSTLVHVGFCLIALFGAFKLKKWLLIPYLCAELVRFLFFLIFHIVTMVILKKNINLGLLIAATNTGGFVLLFLGYRWSAVVSLFQIITVINTQKYKSLYGDDPFAPWSEGEEDFQIATKETDQLVRSVRMFSTPPDNDFKKGWEPIQVNFNNRQNVAIIPIDQPDIALAVREYQNLYVNELYPARRSNLMRY